MAAQIRLKRGTLAQLNAAASANQLVQGEPYFITDTNEIAIGLTASTYQIYSKTNHTHTLSNISDFPAAVSATELGYLDGVTSAIQTQIDGKAASSHNHSATNITSGTLATARGGTNQTSWTANRLVYANSTTQISALAAITANRALISDANGLPIHSAVTNTELGYVSGVTSAIQTQLDGKQASLGFTAENSANKENTTIDTSTTKYPTVNLLKTGLDGKAAASHSHAISDVTNLQTSLDAKQATLVSGTNIKTVNSNSLLGSGDLVVPPGWNTVTLATQTIASLADITGFVTPTLTQNQMFTIKVYLAGQCSKDLYGSYKPYFQISTTQTANIWFRADATYNIGGSFAATVTSTAGNITASGATTVLTISTGGAVTYNGTYEFFITGKWTNATSGTIKLRAYPGSSSMILTGCVMEYKIW